MRILSLLLSQATQHLADDNEFEVFKYLKDKGYRKLNEDKGGFTAGDDDKTPTVDNFFPNFGELEDLQVIDDKKTSDHNLI